MDARCRAGGWEWPALGRVHLVEQRHRVFIVRIAASQPLQLPGSV